MNSRTQIALSVWHSLAFQVIIFTVCSIILITVLRNFLREFVDCGECLIPSKLVTPKLKKV